MKQTFLLCIIVGLLSFSSFSQGNLTVTYDVEEDSSTHYRTCFMEWNYVVIPSSWSHGAQIHFEVPARKKIGKIWNVTGGFGGSYIQHDYIDEQFGGYNSNVFLRRYSGHSTLGLNLGNKAGGVTVRGGYNFMRIEYEYTNFGACYDCQLKSRRDLHRIHSEIVAFKSFSRNKPDVGFLLGCQYLYSPREENSDLLILKVGLGF